MRAYAVWLVGAGALLTLSCGSVSPVAVHSGDQCFRCRRPITERATAAELMDGNRFASKSEARGDGAIASSLKKRPADLTQLKRRNDGVFPSERVAQTIDGRKGGGHDDTDMPRWGEVFGKSSQSASPHQTAERIDTLVKYLDTLQAK